MGLFRFIRYKRVLNARKRHYATLALSLAMAHASLGAVKYKSIGNGLADISLALDDNLKFKLDVESNIEHRKYSMSGKWIMQDDYYVLKFDRVQKDLRELFTGSTGFASYAQVSDKKTIKFPTSRAGLLIDGIYCLRSS
ncbi:MAG: hypothetical protein Salg2KO_16200 [Salibacteraceae bacterium]